MWSWPTGRGMSGGEEVLSGILKCRENSVFASDSPHRGFCAILVEVCIFKMSCFLCFNLILFCDLLALASFCFVIWVFDERYDFYKMLSGWDEIEKSGRERETCEECKVSLFVGFFFHKV